jgi:hypothetical protein
MRKSFKYLWIPILISGLAFGMTMIFSKEVFFSSPEKKFHSENERKTLQQKISSLKQNPSVHSTPLAQGEYFLHSESCRTCHGFDSANYANLDYSGTSINLFDDWESSMMALSAKDPLWRAKVSHEILVNPSHAGALQDKCTSCHAPMGNYTNYFHGQGPYLMDSLLTDTLGLDGISCTSCHTMGTTGAGFSLGSSFSGHIPYDTLRKIYGPYTNPIIGPMQLYTGYTPTYSAHMSESRACSPCHTLITETADLNGVATGNSFVEQATYHEWLNSSFSADNITCQNCHMPQITDSIRIANGYLNLPPRSPFNKHKFHGANTFMLKLMKENKSKLHVNVPDKNFDSTIAITQRNIRHNSVSLKIFQDSINADTAFYRVRLINKAGHKFPSGYPSRRAVLQFVVLSLNNDTLFQSGILNHDGSLAHSSGSYQQHYQTINSPSQSQVYEFIMGDVNGNRTTVLERADTSLKDNRLPPEGFITSHVVYDTVKITGGAASDPDFNLYSPGVEGSGRDYVHFHIPLGSFPPTFNVYARLYYQTLPPEWLQEMFAYNSAAIDSFKLMFQGANKLPELVDADSVLNIVLAQFHPELNYNLVIAPDPTADGNTQLLFEKQTEISLIRILDLNGKEIRVIRPTEKLSSLPISLPEEKGTYILDIYTEGKRITKKVIRQ